MSNNDDKTQPTQHKKLSVPEIVGIVIGGCVVLIFLLFLLYKRFGPNTKPSSGGLIFMENGNYVHANKQLFEKYGYN